MKNFDWNEQKNSELKKERDVGFEDIVIAVGEGGLLDIIVHPNKKRYPSQKIFIVEICQYVYCVPFVEDEEKMFLKTIIPSRKATEQYLINRKHKRNKK